ncbi:MAG: nucleotide pyrophosphohydrolase [Pirellulaceae bacterium]
MDDTETSVSELRQIMREFVAERNWQKFHNAKNLTMSLAIEAGELMEHFQWLTTEEVEAQQGYDLAAVSDELADVVCYALSLANALEIDLTAAITSKMVQNRLKYPIE